MDGKFWPEKGTKGNLDDLSPRGQEVLDALIADMDRQVKVLVEKGVANSVDEAREMVRSGRVA